MRSSSRRGRWTAPRKQPLVEISNGGKPSRPIPINKKQINSSSSSNPPLDGLLHIRSDLSQLVAQIDDLVAKASEHKMFSRTASQDIESFGNVLSDMVSSLKPWASRLEKVFGIVAHQVDQPLETKTLSCSNKNANVASNNEDGPDLILSPSPLVTWHAGTGGGGTFKLESGRQLFLLTPLPKPKFLSSECPVTSNSLVRILHDEDNHLEQLSTLPKESHHGTSWRLEAGLVQGKALTSCTKGAKDSTSEDALSSLFQHPNGRNWSVSQVPLTPCLNKSPAKTCPLLDLIPENISEQAKIDSGCSDDLASGEVSRSVASRYQELLGLKHNHSFTTRREEESETLDWFLSPPKTCILMEPTDEKPVPTPANSFGVMLATPLWMNAESTVQKGKQPGENTLKKELWRRFEEVSADGMHYDASRFQRNTRKGFLDMLEEASCETTDPDCKVSRKQ